MNKFILALTLVTSFISGSVNARVIDDFSDGSMHLVADTINTFQSSSSAFGGGRGVSIIKQGYNAKVDIIAPLGLYAHSTNALTSATSTISWSSQSGIDLVENTNNNVFALDIFSNDQENSNFVISVIDSAEKTAFSTLLNPGEGIYNIAFSSFIGINFHQITDIKLQIIGGLESDIVLNSLSTSIGQVSAVPTPTSLILFTSSLAIVLSMSRRKVGA